LSNNYFSAEEDLLFLVKIPLLKQAILYGNPVTYRNKQAGAVQATALEDERREGRVVNLVTDDPAAAAAKPKSFGTYSNFKVTKVTDRNMPSLADWRAAGATYMLEDGQPFE
jgi:hypothetical protein